MYIFVCCFLLPLNDVFIGLANFPTFRQIKGVIHKVVEQNDPFWGVYIPTALFQL